jgi:hypothetical protein
MLILVSLLRVTKACQNLSHMRKSVPRDIALYSTLTSAQINSAYLAMPHSHPSSSSDSRTPIMPKTLLHHKVESVLLLWRVGFESDEGTSLVGLASECISALKG